VLLVLGLCLAAGLFALAVGTQTAQAAGTGDITGSVTAQVGGGALANINVNAYASLDDYNNGNQAVSTQTNTEGTYDLVALPAGSYLIEFRDDNNGDYLTQYYNGKASARTPCWPPPATSPAR
jgi:uncharacterized protein (DUF2141 family)